MNQTRIESLVTTQGHLERAPLAFVPGLNCIIGARGTCKSTIVETLRFLFDSDPSRVAELLEKRSDATDGPSHAGLIRATLRGGTARMVLRREAHDAHSEITVERDTVSESRAYIDGIKAVTDRSFLELVEIYSQGELQEIALSSSKRLALVDRPHQAVVDDAQGRSRQLAAAVSELGPQMRELRDSIDASRRALREGEPLRGQLAQTQAARPTLSPGLAQMRETHQAAERLLEQAEDTVKRARQDRRAFDDAVAQLRATATAAAFLDRGPDSVLTGIATELTARADAAASASEAFKDDSALETLLAQARAKLDAQSAPYFAARKTEETVNEALRQEDRLVEEVARLDRIAGDLRASEAKLESLIAKRDELRAQLATVRNDVFHKRLHEVDRINAEFSDRIILTLNQGTRTEGYREALDELLSGSYLRDQAALCQQIAAVLPPADFVGRVEREDAAGLAQILNREEGQMLRLVSHAVTDDRLYALERDISDDELEITMIVDGRPKSVGEMSKGQKATAILPLLLRSASYPLVLDQPEDDLDNRFIYDTLVTSVACLKHERQLIFVTHNANIPVIGDAGRIFVMSMTDQDHAVVTMQGTVDEVRGEILSLLEGGETAFTIRSETYGLGPHVAESS
jgi:DNA repair ATPase RecN